MIRIQRRISRKILLLFAGDALLLYASLWATLAIRYLPEERVPLFELHLFPFTVVFSLWLALIGAFGLYELRLLKNSKMFLYRLIQIMTVNTVAAIVIFYVFPFAIEPRRNLLLLAAIATAFFFGWRLLFNLAIPRAPALRVMFLGVTRETVDLADYLLVNPQLGYRPVAFVSHGQGLQQPLPSLPVLPHLILGDQGLGHIAADFKPQMIVVSPEMKNDPAVVSSLFGIIGRGIATPDFPSFHEMITGKVPFSLIGEAWFLENLIGAQKRGYERAKRVMDLALATLLALVALATFPLIAAAIKLDSRGPVFFRQRRVGRGAGEFTLVKYRSMVENAHEFSGLKSASRDPRHTAVGAWLRRTYLDELPQIINVFRGDMSFVGPRPERPEYVRNLKTRVPFYEMRLLATPGITGWAQINMDNDASVEDAPEKMQYDLYYVKNRSLTLDLLIMLRTIFTLARREGR